MTLGRCIRPNCTTAAIRTLGAEALCPEHVEAVLAPIRARVLTEESNTGSGRQVGPLEENWGEQWSVLRCDQCGASWGGRDGDACTWCYARAELLIVEQRRLVLRRPGIDPNDARAEAANIAWAERLGRAVKSGLLDRRTALAALAAVTNVESAAS